MSTDPLARLVAELSRLPGIGPKTATRLAHHIMRVPPRDARGLAEAIVEVKERLIHCTTCNNITAEDPCSICTDDRRDRSRICVVEEPFNIQPIERTGEYSGLYHALMGALSPQRGIGPDQLAIDSLLERLEGVEEVIVATNPNVEGEATALFLARVLRARGIRVTRLAFGLPIGGDIDYVDEVTLARSFSGRRDL
ncbi:MAG: recombination mediator RecR [Thermoanaerobaculia bacterium]|nr:recombination mediator RecR [Thermoanaerobaculia bacterium]